MREITELDRVEAVLFDMDGVLAESKTAWFHTFNSVREELELPKVSWDVLAKHFGQSTERDVEVFFKGLTVEEIGGMYERHFPRFMDLVEPLPQARELLRKISESGLKTGCVTNTPRALALGILRGLDLLDFLSVVVGGDDVGRGKPDPEPILKALDILGVSPGRACFVGDTVYDVEAARRAGCIPIGLGVESGIRVESLMELIYLLGLR